LADHAPRIARQARAADEPGTAASSAAARLDASAPVRQLRATAALLNARPSGVVQRVVLHKIIDGTVHYYSDLKSGKGHHATRDEAEKDDRDELAKEGRIKRALYHSSKKKGEDPKPRRSNTPYSYGMKTPGKGRKKDISVSAAPNKSAQGPHSLSFSSTEYRLQKRLAQAQGGGEKGRHALANIRRQVLTPDAFESVMDNERPDNWASSDHRKRMKLDYKSLHDKFEDLHASGPHGPDTHYHLIARQIMQMHPYTTYGVGVGSSGKGERKNARHGKNSIDPDFLKSAKNPKEAERYLALRQHMFHGSDSESDHSDYEPYTYQHIDPKTEYPPLTLPLEEEKKKEDSETETDEELLDASRAGKRAMPKSTSPEHKRRMLTAAKPGTMHDTGEEEATFLPIAKGSSEESDEENYFGDSEDE